VGAVSRAVVRTQSREEREYARVLQAVETRKRRIAHLQAEIDGLRETLDRFSAMVFGRIGLLTRALGRLRTAIANYERLIALHSPDEDAPLEPEIEDTDEADGETETEESRQYERAFRRQRKLPSLDAAAEAEVKRLYRDLAWRYHPDLARTDDERRRREVLMRRVNAAFHDRDLKTLHALYREAEVTDPSFEARPIAQRLEWARQEVARLDTIVVELESELAEVQGSKGYRLWNRPRPARK
jgi:hypothetical protein